MNITNDFCKAIIRLPVFLNYAPGHIEGMRGRGTALHMLNLAKLLNKQNYTLEDFSPQPDDESNSNIFHLLVKAASGLWEDMAEGNHKQVFLLSIRGRVLRQRYDPTLEEQNRSLPKYYEFLGDGVLQTLFIPNNNYFEYELAAITEFLLNKLSQEDIFQLLLQRDINGQTPLMAALAAGRDIAFGIVTQLFNFIAALTSDEKQRFIEERNKAKQGFLHLYAANNWYEVRGNISDWFPNIETFIANLYDTDSLGNTPLHYLCRRANFATLKAIFFGNSSVMVRADNRNSITTKLDWEKLLVLNVAHQTPLSLALTYAEPSFNELFLKQIPPDLLLRESESTHLPHISARSLQGLLFAHQRLPEGSELKDKKNFAQKIIGSWLENVYHNQELCLSALESIATLMLRDLSSLTDWFAFLDEAQKGFLFEVVKSSSLIHFICTKTKNAEALQKFLELFSSEQQSLLAVKKADNTYPFMAACHLGNVAMARTVKKSMKPENWVRVIAEVTYEGIDAAFENLPKQAKKDISDFIAEEKRKTPLLNILEYFTRQDWMIFESHYEVRLANFLGCLEAILKYIPYGKAESISEVQVLPAPSSQIKKMWRPGTRESDYIKLWRGLNFLFNREGGPELLQQECRTILIALYTSRKAVDTNRRLAERAQDILRGIIERALVDVKFFRIIEAVCPEIGREVATLKNGQPNFSFA